MGWGRGRHFHAVSGSAEGKRWGKHSQWMSVIQENVSENGSEAGKCQKEEERDERISWGWKKFPVRLEKVSSFLSPFCLLTLSLHKVQEMICVWNETKIQDTFRVSLVRIQKVADFEEETRLIQAVQDCKQWRKGTAALTAFPLCTIAASSSSCFLARGVVEGGSECLTTWYIFCTLGGCIK